MTRGIHLWPEEHRLGEGRIEAPAVLEGVGPEPMRLCFGLPAEEAPNLTPSADPFVLAALFQALRSGADLEVHGAVSPTLLRGLEEFQAAWCRWRPRRYRRFSVSAAVEREAVREGSGGTVMTFSGGLDSCCTAWRHGGGALGRRRRKLGAGLIVHGFDVPLEQEEVFARAAARARAVLESIGVRLIPITCNVRVLQDDWEDSHGAALAACLHLLAGGYTTGLIASSHAYETLRFPWGSNPLTDPMLASASFTIIHDGCDLTRWEKADAIGDWDAALRHLRVCWEGEQLDRNCGRCMRCVATALCFAATGRPIPPSVPVPTPGEAVERLSVLDPDPIQLGHLENMALAAKQRRIGEPWVAALKRLARRKRRAGRRVRSLRRGLPRWSRVPGRARRPRPPED